MNNDITPFKTAQLMQNNTFEIFHYREPYFKSLDFHSHEFFEAYLFLDGRVTYYIEDKVYDLIAGDLLIIPPFLMHRPVIEKENAVYERIVLWLSYDFLNKSDLNGEPLFPSLSAFNQENGYLIGLSGEELSFAISLLSRISGGEACYQQSLICAFLSHACECHTLYKKNSQMEEELIPRVIRFLNESFTRHVSLDELSERFFVSKFHLSRQFKKHTNATVYDYILGKRVALAKQLLHRGTAANVVSEQCGFSDYSNFYKIFKQQTSLSPNEFKRKRNLKAL